MTDQAEFATRGEGLADQRLGRRAALRAGIITAGAAVGATALGRGSASATSSPFVTTDPLTNNTYIQPSGDTFGVTDASNINTALNTSMNGQNVVLAAGQFYVNTTIVIPPGCVLKGQFANEVDQIVNPNNPNAGHAWGSVITAVDTSRAPWASAVVWPGSSKNIATISAVVACVGQEAGQYADPGDECKIYGLAIDCSNFTGLADPNLQLDGLQIFGDISRAHIERVLIAGANGAGFNMVNFIDNTATPNPKTYGPGAAHLNRVNSINARSDGFHHEKISDCTYIDCLAEQCGGNGFYIENGSNGVWTACRAEHNTNNGFLYNCTSVGTGTGVARLIGCSTDRNTAHGIYITVDPNLSSASPPPPAPSSALPLVLSGCTFRRDGSLGAPTQNPSNLYGGITVSHYPGPVQISGCTVWPGVGDTGDQPNSPYWGMRLIQNTNGNNVGQVLVAGSYIQGAVSFLKDDGTTEARWGPDVTGATGSTSGAVVRGPRMGTATLTGGTTAPAGVSCSCVTSTSIILLTTAVVSGTPGHLSVSALNATAGTFQINSTSATDNSKVNWQILNP